MGADRLNRWKSKFFTDKETLDFFQNRNMAGQEFTIKPHKPKKRKVHWHLLMIGDNGKVFNFSEV
jgi:hypothetical protein